MIRFRAAWILPICAPPIDGGYVRVSRGRIEAIGMAGRAHGEPSLEPLEEVVDLGSVVVMPGLVNAHTHLELSWMRGRVPPESSMPAWARALIRLRVEAGADDEDAIRAAAEEAKAAGTALVGDIGNTLASAKVLAIAGLPAVVFHELIGFRTDRATAIVSEARERIAALGSLPDVEIDLAAHAPYSVAPDLIRAIRDATPPHRPWSLHLAESPEELLFLRTGTGAWRDLLTELGAWSGNWQVPQCGPVEYLGRLGLLDGRVVAAHGVHLADEELEHLGEMGVTVVTCPRSNQWTGAGRPPIDRFYASGVRVAVGTDSLASCPNLNMFTELHELRRLAPGVPARVLLRWATENGAVALRRSADYGTIEPGKRAALIAVATGSVRADVEEYLVNGIGPDQIAWLRGPESEV
jgi:cytosine/adenosine deaminase-related metal-dependent hydrolase